jgi:hypothetical protein
MPSNIQRKGSLPGEFLHIILSDVTAPAETASRIRSAGKVLETATRVTSDVTSDPVTGEVDSLPMFCTFSEIIQNKHSI